MKSKRGFAVVFCCHSASIVCISSLSVVADNVPLIIISRGRVLRLTIPGACCRLRRSDILFSHIHIHTDPMSLSGRRVGIGE